MMRKRHFLASAMLLLGCVTTLVATTTHVPGDYPQIQAAITVANVGDVVLIDPGTYQEKLDFLGKPILVTGTDPSDPAVVSATVVDASLDDGSVVSFVSGEDAGAVLRGLTLTGGVGTWLMWPGSGAGGGIYCESDAAPVIANCTLRGNTAEEGGGYIYWQAPRSCRTACSWRTPDAASAEACVRSAQMSSCRVASSGVTPPMVKAEGYMDTGSCTIPG
jgi:hypothetical protein